MKACGFCWLIMIVTSRSAHFLRFVWIFYHYHYFSIKVNCKINLFIWIYDFLSWILLIIYMKKTWRSFLIFFGMRYLIVSRMCRCWKAAHFICCEKVLYSLSYFFGLSKGTYYLFDCLKFIFYTPNYHHYLISL